MRRAVVACCVIAVVAVVVASIVRLQPHNRQARALGPPTPRPVHIVSATPGSGDVNGDGIVNAVDAYLVMQFVAELGAIVDPNAADTRADGTIDVVDAEMILQFASGIFAHQLPIHPGTPGPPPTTAPLISIASGYAGPSADRSLDLSARFAPPGLGAWMVDVTFDPSVVRLVTCLPQGQLCNAQFRSNVARVIGASANGYVGASALATLVFRCVGPVASSPLHLTVGQIADAQVGDPQLLQAQTSDGAITCTGSAVTPTPVAPHGTVQGTVWNDANANGLRDGGEGALPGWQVVLHPPCCTNAPARFTTTGTDGTFTFDHVPVGTATVCLGVPLGWAPTTASGNVYGSYCSGVTSPPLYVSSGITVTADAAATADFGVVQRRLDVAAHLECPATVILGHTFDCALQLVNNGDVGLSSVAAWASRAVCFGNLSPELGGPGCIVGSAFGRRVGLEYVSSNPTWTGTNPQYGDHEWSPFGSGELQPGGSAALAVTYRATVIDQPGNPEMICIGSTGQPTFGSYVSPVTMRPQGCQEINITSGPPGDVDCSGVADSIDATIILQFAAGLLFGVPCEPSADVNHDGTINSLDALLVLQFTAGLIPTL